MFKLSISKKKFRVVAILLLVLIILFWFSGPYYLSKYFGKKAILNASFGMSPEQIEAVNNFTLTRNKLPFDLLTICVPVFVDMQRYKFMTSDEIILFGESTEIDYDFFDNKLYNYVVTMRLNNKDKVEDEILPLLESQYGTGSISKPNAINEIQSREWKTSNKKISFSLYQAGADKNFEVLIRVKYLPIYKDIERASDNEKSSYF